MDPTPTRTDDRPAEGITADHMTDSEAAAVTGAIAERLRPQGDPDGLYHAPVTPGLVCASRDGALWVTWSVDPEWDRATWFRVMDVPSNPEEGFSGARIVRDADGRPLGSLDGPLVLSELCGAPTAFCINTGSNYATEILWSRDS